MSYPQDLGKVLLILHSPRVIAISATSLRFALLDKCWLPTSQSISNGATAITSTSVTDNQLYRA